MKTPDYEMETHLDIFKATRFITEKETNEFDVDFGIRILEGDMKSKCFQYNDIFLISDKISFNVIEFKGDFEEVVDDEVSEESMEVYGNILVRLLENGKEIE